MYGGAGVHVGSSHQTAQFQWFQVQIAQFQWFQVKPVSLKLRRCLQMFSQTQRMEIKRYAVRADKKGDHGAECSSAPHPHLGEKHAQNMDLNLIFSLHA